MPQGFRSAGQSLGAAAATPAVGGLSHHAARPAQGHVAPMPRSGDGHADPPVVGLAPGAWRRAVGPDPRRLLVLRPQVSDFAQVPCTMPLHLTRHAPATAFRTHCRISAPARPSRSHHQRQIRLPHPGFPARLGHSGTVTHHFPFNLSAPPSRLPSKTRRRRTVLRHSPHHGMESTRYLSARMGPTPNALGPKAVMRHAEKPVWTDNASATKSIAICASPVLYPLVYYPGQGSSLARTGLAHPILAMIEDPWTMVLVQPVPVWAQAGAQIDR
jgi:hypothetical protein